MDYYEFIEIKFINKELNEIILFLMYKMFIGYFQKINSKNENKYKS